MADNKSDMSSDIDQDVEFVSAKQSSDDQESVNMEKMVFGDAFDGLDEDAQEGLKNISKSELKMKDLIEPDEPIGGDGREESKVKGHHPKDGESDSDIESRTSSNNSDPSDPVETNIDVMYTLKSERADEQDVSVLRFSRLFLPDTEKRSKHMNMFNRKIMQDFPEFEDETGRKRKRDLKENYKKCLSQHQRKAKYLPVNPFLEDFYYLQGYSKSGVAPNKKLQVPQGYKPLFSLQKADHHFLEKIQPNRYPHRRQLSKQVHFPSSNPDLNKGGGKDGDSAKAAEKDTGAEKDFTLEACQINELRSRIVEHNVAKTTENVDKNGLVGEDSQEMAQLRQQLKQAKVTLKQNLAQKMPAVRTSIIERQNFAVLNQLNQFYAASSQPSQSQSANQTSNAAATPLKSQQSMINTQMSKRGRGHLNSKSMKPILPTEVEIYEMQIQKKFKQAKITGKRVKYWGELGDLVSEHQVNKDSQLIKRQEWQEFVRNKQGFKQPIFSLTTKNPNHEGQSQAAKDKLNAQGPQGQMPFKPGMLPPHLAMLQGMPGMRPEHLAAQQGASAQGGRPGRRPPPLVVDKSDFDLVTSFEEYEKLKEQEAMHYRQRKKTKVTAESIMRHVRWKMGRLSDKEFYREELQEMRREEQLEDKAKQQQRQMPQRRTSAISTPQTDLTDTEPKDLESTKRHRTVPIDFEENLDTHFDRKRVEIQERILRKKGEKERASQQKQNTTQTPAYEPIVPQDQKESESVQNGSDHNNNPSDNDSSSSDSDSDSDEAIPDRHQPGAGHTMLADELNHAHCIKNLSFFKLNWDNRDLETFHRPNIQNYFLENTAASRKMPASAISTKKEDKETRLNPHLYFKTRFKLSLNKGKFCIFEHIDQHPLFLNNFGMASRLKRYYYGDKQPTKKEFLNQKSENIANRHIGPYGKFLFKDNLEKLDLLGQVDKSKYKGLTMLENNMYNAPVFYHRMPSTNNDFYCSVIKQSNTNDSRIVVRSLNSFFTVGQIEPKREVYNPQSRHFTHFIKQQSKAYTTRLLQENKVMSFHDIRQFFPQIGSPILKKGLKEIEVEQDRNGLCRLNANFAMERHEDRMTPEMICQFESARHGQYRLERLGIGEILSADKISYSTHKFCFEETDLILQRVAKLIESEVLQTPWNLSSNYIKIKQESSMMMLEGQGDPSYGHGGYSYLKMPLKISADSIQGAKANRMNLNPAIQNPKAVTGTEADLRKLKKLQLQDILHEAGVPENILDTKTRWEMVAMLRCFASQQMPPSQYSQQNGHTMKSFYARGVRNTSKKQQEMYNKRADSTFRKQMDTLSDVNSPKDLHELSEDEPDFTQLPDLDAMGLEKIGKGFGTSLNKGKGDKSKADKIIAEITLREPGENAKDFTRDIYILVNDESRKQIVEIELMPEVKKIEDIKDYLKLFLVIHPNALSPQNQNPSGINIGGVSSNAEFLYAMNGNGSKEWEKKLLEKLQNREISKKCSILCHKIRSLTKDDGQEASKNDDPENALKYERVIFCADEKAIKKFKRCMNKNSLRTPRRTTRRNMTKVYRPLTNNNLNRHDAKDQKGGSRSQVRSNSRSVSAHSAKNTGSAIHRGSESKSRRGDGSMYSQPMGGKIKVGIQGSNRTLNLQGSGQKPKTKKRSSKPVVVNPAPLLRFNITNNGTTMPQAPPQVIGATSFGPIQSMDSSQPQFLTQSSQPAQILDHQQPWLQAQQQQPLKPISIVALSGPNNVIPMSQPVDLTSNMVLEPQQQQSMISLSFPSSQPTNLVVMNTGLNHDAEMLSQQNHVDNNNIGLNNQLQYNGSMNALVSRHPNPETGQQQMDLGIENLLHFDRDVGDAQMDKEDRDDVNLVNNDEVVSNIDSIQEPEYSNNIEESSDDEYGQLVDYPAMETMPAANGRAKGGNSSAKKSKKRQAPQGRYSQQHMYLQSQTSQLSMNRQKSIKSNSRSRKNQSSTQKFQKHGFSNDDFEYQNLTANKSRRRQQQDGTQSLNNIFMEIIDHLSLQEGAFMFHNQPTRQDAPNYRDLIRCPIALKDMKNKAKRNEYKKSATFLSDVALMVENAEKFNGPVHYIAKLAKDLQSKALAQINGKIGDIETMECVIKMDGL